MDSASGSGGEARKTEGSQVGGSSGGLEIVVMSVCRTLKKKV